MVYGPTLGMIITLYAVVINTTFYICNSICCWLTCLDCGVEKTLDFRSVGILVSLPATRSLTDSDCRHAFDDPTNQVMSVQIFVTFLAVVNQIETERLGISMSCKLTHQSGVGKEPKSLITYHETLSCKNSV